MARGLGPFRGGCVLLLVVVSAVVGQFGSYQAVSDERWELDADDDEFPGID